MITFGRSPIIMDAQGDDLTSIFQGRDMNDTTPVVRLKVVQIRYVAGGSGKMILMSGSPVSKPSSTIIFQSADLNDGQADETAYAGWGIWMDGVYVLQMPAGGRVFIDYV